MQSSLSEAHRKWGKVTKTQTWEGERFKGGGPGVNCGTGVIRPSGGNSAYVPGTCLGGWTYLSRSEAQKSCKGRGEKGKVKEKIKGYGVTGKG